MTQYSGKIIRKNPVVPTQTSASGVWTVTDAAAATKNNAWPVAGVPDPISRSVRLRSSASAYLNRTLGTPTDGKKFTWSGWVKRGTLGSDQELFMAYTGANNRSFFVLTSDTLAFYQYTSGTYPILVNTSTQVLRDPSAWYHIVCQYDSTQATSTNRVKIYVNNVQVAFPGSPTYPSLNYVGDFNTATPHGIGRDIYNNTSNFDGYLTEVNFIDGQQLTPSSFGTTDAFTGAWVPMAYTGTYGTNGFYLNFKDNTSTTTLGYDYSGNSNNWTANNISLTAGTTYDSMLDVPTPWVGYNTDGGVSVTRGNYAVLNPLAVGSAGTSVVNNGNLSFANGSAHASITSSMGVTSGKYYFECTVVTSNPGGLGFTTLTAPYSAFPNAVANLWWVYDNGGNFTGFSQTTTIFNVATKIAVNQVWQVALDMDNGKAWIGINNTWYDASGGSTGNPSTGANAMFSSIPSTNPMHFFVECAGNGWAANFGQRPFSYTPPTGFKTLCTTNLPDPTIKLGAQYFAATTYTGNGSTQSIVNSGNNTTATTFQPDLVWIKARAASSNHAWTDSVRGAYNMLLSSSTNAEANYSPYGASAFNSNGFSVSDISSGGYNVNGSAGGAFSGSSAAYIAWQWKAGGAAVSNTAGTITSQVSANTTAGFSVVTYTGTGSAATVGHGLGVAPKMIIIKTRSLAGENWVTYHSALGATSPIYLNLTLAAGSGSGVFNSTAPTSSVFSVGTSNGVNGSGYTYVAYCFAEVAGYSAFGSYTGNASTDGPFIYCGFRPRYILIKGSSYGASWYVFDTGRSTYNEDLIALNPDASSSEASSLTTYGIDILSNGFKTKQPTGYGLNNSGQTYIYMAVAENPFKYSNAR